MAVRDLGDYLDDCLEIPVGGKTYRIPSPDAETGLRLTALAQLGIRAYMGMEVDLADLDRIDLDDDEENDLIKQVLGPIYQQMLDDKVSWMRIQRVARYAFLYFAVSPEAAEEAAARSRLGEAPALNRSSRRAASKSPKASSGTAKKKTVRGSTAGSKSNASRKASPLPTS